MTAPEDVFARVTRESMEDSFRHGVGCCINVVDAAAAACPDQTAAAILRVVADQLRRISAEFTLAEEQP